MEAFESKYPESFRREDTLQVTTFLNNGFSVNLVGLPKVGLSCFMRFLAFNPIIIREYFSTYKIIFFNTDELPGITVDNFWQSLLYKIEPEKMLKSLSFENVCQRVGLLWKREGKKTIFFLNKFDRLSPIYSPQFFANLQALRNFAKEAVHFVITTNRPIHEIYPIALNAATIHLLGNTYFLKPALFGDTQIYLQEFPAIPKLLHKEIYQLSGGHQQLTQIIASNFIKGLMAKSDWRSSIILDPRLQIRFTEIQNILTKEEKEFLEAFVKLKKSQVLNPSSYLVESGFLVAKNGSWDFFSPLIKSLLKPTRKSADLTLSEQKLLDYLMQNKGQLCCKEDLIWSLWPDNEEITDWALHKLIGRLRQKLCNSGFSILNLKGQGYKLCDKIS